MEPWNCDTTEFWTHGTMESWNHITMESQNYGILGFWNHGTTESFRLEKPPTFTQPNQHGRATPTLCPQGPHPRAVNIPGVLSHSRGARAGDTSTEGLAAGMWDSPENGQWDFLDNGISPWALSQRHIHHKRAKAAFPLWGQSHPRPVQDFRTDLSTSPNSPQGPVIPGKAAGSAPSASAQSQAWPELS